MVKFFQKQKAVVDVEQQKDISKNLKKFIKKHKNDYLDLQNAHSKLFNLVGEELKSEPAQLQFTGVLIYGFLYSIKCDKENKRKLVQNVLDKL